MFSSRKWTKNLLLTYKMRKWENPRKWQKSTTFNPHNLHQLCINIHASQSIFRSLFINKFYYFVQVKHLKTHFQQVNHWQYLTALIEKTRMSYPSHYLSKTISSSNHGVLFSPILCNCAPKKHLSLITIYLIYLLLYVAPIN